MVTKRQLGLFMLTTGLIAIVALLVIDWIGAGKFSGIGPVQRLALVAAGLIVALGFSLIPFGDRPA
jgi:hypothetical protein